MWLSQVLQGQFRGIHDLTFSWILEVFFLEFLIGRKLRIFEPKSRNVFKPQFTDFTCGNKKHACEWRSYRTRGFLFKTGPGESALGFWENKKAEYLGKHSERQLEMLKVGISVKLNIVNFNRFWVELSTANNRFNNNSASIYLLKVNSRNSRKSCEIYTKLTLKTPEQRQWCFSGVYW